MDLPAITWDKQFQPYNYLEGLQDQQGVKENQQLGDLQIATKKQEMNTENALAPFKINEAQQQDTLKTKDYEDQMIASVAQRAKAADPADAPQIWDSGMQDLASKGIAVARQYVGHYRSDLADHVYDTFTTGHDQAASSAAPPGVDSDAVTRAVAQMPPQAVTKSLANLNQAISGFNRVQTSQDLRNEVTLLKQSGMNVDAIVGGLNLGDDSPAGYAANYAVIHNAIAKAAYFRDQLMSRAAGLSAGIDAQPKPLYEPQIQYIGTSQDTGQAQGFDAHTGKPVALSTGPIGPKPSTAMSTFQMKQQAWLAANPGDTQGALQFANGKRSMEPAQLHIEALKIANQQLYDETTAGAVIPNPDRWVAQRAAQIEQQLTGAGAAPRGAPGGKGSQGASRPAAAAAPPSRALQSVKAGGGKPVRFQNGQVWAWKNGKAVRVQ